LKSWAIVVAAGTGERFGGPKQYQLLGGRRVMDWSIDAARHACAGVVLVVPLARAADPEPAVDTVVTGGTTRSGSVRNGLAAVPDDADVIVVHDAARPLAPERLWEAVIDAITVGNDAAVPVVPVTDTLRRAGGGTVDRREFVAVQTPQAFRAEVLRRAHRGEPEGTDDASLVEAIGGRVVEVEGDPDNRKITTAADIDMMAAHFR